MSSMVPARRDTALEALVLASAPAVIVAVDETGTFR